jgi:multidrug efflux pump subunit AcrB
MLRNSYQWLVVFAMLSLLGAALLPGLPLQLAPSAGGQTLTVSFRWAGASPEALERQITAPIEGALSTLTGVRQVRSRSNYQSGQVVLDLDPAADADALRFEVASVLRQVHARLPREASYPLVRLNTPDEVTRHQPLLILRFTGSAPPAALQRYAEEILKPRLAQVEGLSDVQVYGSTRPEWVLSYEPETLNALGLTELDLNQALRGYFRRESLGLWQPTGTGHAHRLTLRPPDAEGAPEAVFGRVFVKNQAGRLLRLTDVVRVSQAEPPAESLYRVNGQTAITLVLTAAIGTNQLRLAERLRLALAGWTLPPGDRLEVDFDSTEFIRDNLRKIGIQTGVAVLVLLLFVIVTTRSWRYVLALSLTTVVTLLLSVLGFAALGVELHLYSLAALTTSLGILIDNAIVMLDHYRRHRTLRVWLALLGATLTTSAGLVVLWFLPETTRRPLTDFAVVMAVTLGASLAVAVGFVPALVERWGWWTVSLPPTRRRAAALTALRWNRRYARLLTGLFRYRRAALAGAVLAFGLPVFWLPHRLAETHPLAGAYNATLGSEWYVEHLRPVVNRWLGGTLRLFTQYVYEGASFQNTPERTKLYVLAELPNQSTPEQLGELMRKVETELARYPEIDRYVTQVPDGQQAITTVFFREPYDQGTFPYQLKSRMVQLSTETSGVDWDIYGVGTGFSQHPDANSTPRFSVELLGYNYAELERQALALKRRLEGHPRVQEVDITRSPAIFQRKNLDEFVWQTDPATLARQGLTSAQVYRRLDEYSARTRPDQYQFLRTDYEGIRLEPSPERRADAWQLRYHPQRFDSLTVRLGTLGTVVRQKATPEIWKENQQYRRLVSFEYFGSPTFGSAFLDTTLNQFRSQLPLGYTAKRPDEYWTGEQARTPYELLGLVLLLIYAVSAVLFEDLRQPLALLGLVPLSYTGLFLAFYGMDAAFDQGGYAAMVLLAGNAVCAGIFVLSEFNHLREQFPRKSRLGLYVKAIQRKIRPVSLTVFSTVVGMVPFLLFENEPFWYAMGVGTVGGLLASVFALLLFLPLFLGKQVVAQKQAMSFHNNLIRG